MDSFLTKFDFSQVVSDQLSPSYRSPMKQHSDTLFDQYARTKETGHPVRNTYSTLTNSMNLSTRTRRRRLSNTALHTKRIA